MAKVNPSPSLGQLHPILRVQTPRVRADRQHSRRHPQHRELCVCHASAQPHTALSVLKISETVAVTYKWRILQHHLISYWWFLFPWALAKGNPPPLFLKHTRSIQLLWLCSSLEFLPSFSTLSSTYPSSKFCWNISLLYETFPHPALAPSKLYGLCQFFTTSTTFCTAVYLCVCTSHSISELFASWDQK